MERCIAQMLMERLAQPLPYSLRVRENFPLSHFSSRTKVHGGEGTILHYVLSFFTLYEKHVAPRRIIHSYILYDDVLEATCIIEIGYFIGGLWGKPHDFWCAPLTPHCAFMLLSYRMIVAANKWLGEHLLLLV